LSYRVCPYCGKAATELAPWTAPAAPPPTYQVPPPPPGGKFCPNCGARVDPAARFCPSCGKQLTP